MTRVYRLTTPSGLEDIAAKEARELLPRFVRARSRPLGARGHVAVTISDPPEDRSSTVDRLRSLSTIYCVVEHRYALEAPRPTLDWLRASVIPDRFPEVGRVATFRVTCKRTGSHSFTHPEVERAIGGVLVRRYGTAVSLEQPEFVVRVDVTDEVVFFGVQRSEDDLGKRYHWHYRPRVTLRPPVAAAMLRMATHDLERTDTPGTILDPFCGSGTIALEAARLYPGATVLAGDWDGEAVRGTIENARAAKLAVRAEQRDARAMEGVPDASVDLIVTNPPFGVRLAPGIHFRSFYRSVLRELHRVLKPTGRICILAGKRRIDFTRALADVDGLVRTHVRVFDLGGVFPAAFILAKRGTAGPSH